MNKKLTISIDESTLEKARDFAKSRGLSLSEIIENYLKLISNNSEPLKISSKILKLKGSIDLSKSIEYNGQ